MPRFDGYSRRKILLAFLWIITVVILLGISNYYLSLPARLTSSESFGGGAFPLSLGRGETFQYDLNITYLPQYPLGGTMSMRNGIIFLVSKPQNTPTLFNNISLKLGFYLNYSGVGFDSPNLNIWEPFASPSGKLIYSSKFPLPDSSGEISVVSLQLQELALYRIQLQSGGFSGVVGVWTLFAEQDTFTRPQYNSGITTLGIAVIIAGGAPLTLYVNQRRSHSLSSPSDARRVTPH